MKKSLFEEIRLDIDDSILANDTGKPRQAVHFNKRAMNNVEKLKKILKENEAIFEANIFLMGESNITRKPKKK